MSETAAEARTLYLDLIENVLINAIYADPPIPGKRWRVRPHNEEHRIIGRDQPSVAHSMIGKKRMHNLRVLATRAIDESIPGDFIETGVWRGGACIYLRAILKAYGVTDRCVWVADSFEGLPKPNEGKYPWDRGDKHWKNENLAISLDEVKANFEIYGLLDEQVKFLKGWFSDTLAQAPIDQIAVLRLDGDMYESTMDALTALYPKVPSGGFVVIDDYGAVEGCRKALHDYLDANNQAVTLHEIDWTGQWFQKP